MPFTLIGSPGRMRRAAAVAPSALREVEVHDRRSLDVVAAEGVERIGELIGERPGDRRVLAAEEVVR